MEDNANLHTQTHTYSSCCTNNNWWSIVDGAFTSSEQRRLLCRQRTAGRWRISPGSGQRRCMVWGHMTLAAVVCVLGGDGDMCVFYMFMCFIFMRLCVVSCVHVCNSFFMCEAQQLLRLIKLPVTDVVTSWTSCDVISLLELLYTIKSLWIFLFIKTQLYIFLLPCTRLLYYIIFMFPPDLLEQKQQPFNLIESYDTLMMNVMNECMNGKHLDTDVEWWEVMDIEFIWFSYNTNSTQKYFSNKLQENLK